jgi:site-specific recombinase XerD
MEAAGIEVPQIGPRGFRHACATQLLHKGHSLSDIADFLGHHNTNSVSIYAKPSVSSIRRVAAFSLGGLK